MKRMVCCALVVMFALSLTAFAATGSAKIELASPALVAGVTLPKGDYKLTWTGEGQDVKVTLTSADKKVTVTAPAKLVTISKAKADSIIRKDDGSVKEIWLAGKAQAFTF